MTIADLFAAQLDEMAEADRRYQARTTATLARIRAIIARMEEEEASEEERRLAQLSGRLPY